AHQIHGGNGVIEENDLYFHTLRAKERSLAWGSFDQCMDAGAAQVHVEADWFYRGSPRGAGGRDARSAASLRTAGNQLRPEIARDWDGVIATFAHPRYELYGTGTVFDGEEAVRGYFAASRRAFPDQANEIITIGAAGDSVLVEFWLTGTHLGPLPTPQ